MANVPTITITEDKINEMLVEVGYPIIDFTDLPYTKDQIKSLFIWPAMRDYYRHFPIKNIKDYPVSGDFSVNFPNENTFGILDHIINNNVPRAGAYPTQDPFVNASNIYSKGSSSGFYGTKYNFNGLNTTFFSRQSELQALKNSFSATKIDVDEINRKVTGYVNIVGRLNIVWAEYSGNFSNIPFSKETDVIHLAASNLLRAWSQMILMQSSESENELDGVFLQDRATELREQVIERWQAIQMPVILRTR